MVLYMLMLYTQYKHGSYDLMCNTQDSNAADAESLSLVALMCGSETKLWGSNLWGYPRSIRNDGEVSSVQPLHRLRPR